jgi:hypothetical protein
LYVKYLTRMRNFYRGCFEMDVVEVADDFSVLESDAWRLMFVVMPAEVAARVEISVPPMRREEVPTKLAFAVRSIRGVRPVAISVGGRVDPVETEWEFRGLRHCDCVDPEGNVIQLVEPADGSS